MIHDIIVFFFGVLLGAFLKFFYGIVLKLRVSTPEFSSVSWEGATECTIELKDGRKYRGSGTVWHQHPSGDRASTFMEGWLFCRWEKSGWERVDEESRRK